MQKDNLPDLVYSVINGFHNFYNDAETLVAIIDTIPNTAGIAFQKTILSRTAILLYVVSLEALVNRVASTFLCKEKENDFLSIKNRFRSLESKWLDFPQFLNEKNLSFSKDDYPWNQFIELIKIRNDYAHFKNDREIYYANYSSGPLKFLKLDDLDEFVKIEMFKLAGINENSIYYPLTGIPINTYSITIEHAKKAKMITDAVINELDKLLGGKIKKDKWLHSDIMTIVKPPYQRV